jgi:membrane associated rhomboid family serine protease
MSADGGPPAEATALPHCYRHPDRETGVTCTRCDRPICPDCLRPAAVGFQCPDCVARGSAGARRAAAPYGGTAANGALVTIVLGVLCGVTFVLTALSSPRGFPEGLRDNSDSTLFGRLALQPAAVAQQHEYWRLVTSMFVHYGPWHLVVNMLALGVVGVALEPVFSRWRYLVLYLVAGLGGSTAVYLFGNPWAPTIGASGAIFGLFGAYVVVAQRARLDYRSMLTIILINIVVTFAIPGISKLAHFGGLFAGTLAAVVLVYAPRGRSRLPVQLLGLGGMVAVLAVLVAVRTGQLTG